MEATVAKEDAADAATSSDETELVAWVSEELLTLPYRTARRRLLDDFEARYLRKLFDSTRGNVARAARKAGMDRTYLIKLLQRHGIR